MSLWLLLAVLVNSPAPNSLDDQAFAIGRELRCPVCQGMPIAESPSTMAQDMMKRVRDMLVAGKNEEQIRGYFVERYGDWVVLDPPKEGYTLWVWMLPPALLLLAVGLGLRTMRRLRSARALGVVSPTPPTSTGTVDPYLQAIRDEVHR